MRRDDDDRWVSDDGHWTWDGASWQPITAAPTDPPPDDAPETPETTATAPTPDEMHPLSPDGSQVWDGTAWVAVDAGSSTASAAGLTSGPARSAPDLSRWALAVGRLRVAGHRGTNPRAERHSLVVGRREMGMGRIRMAAGRGGSSQERGARRSRSRCQGAHRVGHARLGRRPLGLERTGMADNRTLGDSLCRTCQVTAVPPRP